MMLHQDGSRHQWEPGRWWDLVVTMDDATGEVLSGFFVEEEGTWPSFRGARDGGDEGTVRQPVHGPGLALLAHAEGGLEGGQGQPGPESAFAPLLPSMKAKLRDILCLKAERTVGNDNCVAYRGRRLQIPPQRHRCHCVRAKVSVHEYEDGGGTPKRTFHVLRKPDTQFAPDTGQRHFSLFQRGDEPEVRGWEGLRV